MPAPRSTCEPCHRRRVKCDLPDSPGGCTNCTKRGLACPGVRIVAARKPRRGAVIDQVERDYGSASIEVLNFDIPSVASSSHHSSYPTPTPQMDQIWGALVPTPSPTSTENSMATLELSSELAMSMMSTFNVSHGNIFRQIHPQLYVKTFAAACRRFDAVDPNQEIMMRIMIALGARSTYHPAIIEGGDLNYPFTLGLCREGPCRALARTTVSRFEALGLRRNVDIETVQIAASVYFIARTVLSPDETRPLANIAVELFRQVVATVTTEILPNSMIFQTGLIVLWVDGRSAAETGNRPIMTQDDLDDVPALENWLNRPLDDTLTWRLESRYMLHAAMVKILRIYGADFRRPMRRYLQSSLLALPRLWDLLTDLSTRSHALVEKLFAGHHTFRDDANARDEALQSMDNLFLVHTTSVFVAIGIYDVLEEAITKTGQTEWFMPCFEALGKAQTGLKQIARHVELIQRLGEGPMMWIHLVGCMLPVLIPADPRFHTLEHCPGWIRLLAPPASGPSVFTEKEYQWLTDGVQQTGFGAGWGSERWIEILKIRGIYVEPNIDPAQFVNNVPST